MSESTAKYLFTSDDGDDLGYIDLASDDAARSRCQEIADSNQTHVTCVRMIFDCDPSQTRTAEQRNEAASTALECPICDGRGYFTAGQSNLMCNACDGTGIQKRA